MSEHPDFILHTRALSARYVRVLGYCLVAGVLLWWPVDIPLYGDDPVLLASLARVRLGVAIACGVGLLALRAIGDTHRFVIPLLSSAMIVNVALVGVALWTADTRFFYSGYALPLATLPLCVDRNTRALVTSLIAVTYGTSYLVGEQRAPDDTVGNAIGMLSFATLLSVVFGDVFYRTLRDNHAQRVLLDERARKLEELDALKNDFFANVSHELRTPLTLVLGHLRGLSGELSRERVDRAACAQRIETAERNAARLLTLIEELLELARLTSGRAEPRKRPLDLGRLVIDVASNFRPSDPTEGALAVDVEDDLFVEADPRQLRTLAHNLLSNAHKFTEPGRRSVTVRARRGAAGTATIEVEDNGIGIPEAHLARIFERFHRVERGYARAHGGTGIGLALVREIAEAHGGRVEVESTLGRGSRFVVTIPVGDPLRAEQERGSSPEASSADALAELHRLGTRASRADEPEPSSARATTVVVAEDDPDLRRYIASVLARDHRVITASDGEEAIDRVRESRPDVLVTDVMMPGTSGLDVARTLRADAAHARLPILFLTARSGSAARTEGYGAGADDFVTKPFDEAELRARVANLVVVRQSERALSDANRALEARVRERTRDLRRLAGHLERAREDERRFLAREIHDETGQLLTALRMELDLARELASGAELEESLARMASVLDQTLSAMRALVQELRPRVLDDLGLGAAVEWYMERFAARSRIGCRWRVEPAELVASATASTAVYRVLQESLTNVLRHSAAREVEVTLREEGDRIVLHVADDGVGLDPTRPTEGTGVLGMRERAHALGGTLEIASREPRGTLLTLSLPSGEPTEMAP